MAAYHKVEVSLNTNAVEVGIPSPQTVNVVVPTIGPAGPVGSVGPVGPQGPQGVPGTGLEVLTTQGDLLYQGASTGQRLPIGTSGQILRVANGIPSWGNESGAVTSVNGETGAVILDGSEIESSANDVRAAFTAGAFGDGNGIYYPLPDTLLNTKPVYSTTSGYSVFFENSRWHITDGSPITANIIESSDDDNAAWPWLSAWSGDVDKARIADIIGRARSTFLFVGDSVPNTSVSGLGTAATSDSTAFASASHTHGNLTNAGAIGTTANLPLKTGTNGVVEAGSFSNTAGSFCEGNDARLSDARTPSSTLAHKASHATGGTDALAPSDIGAQSIFVTEALGTITADVTLTAARAKIYTVTANASGLAINLPTTNIQTGDVVQIRFTTFTGQTLVVKRAGVFYGNDLRNGQQATYIAASTASNSWEEAGNNRMGAGTIQTSGGPVVIGKSTSGAGVCTELGIGTAAGEVAAGNHTHVVADVTGAAASGSITTSGLTQATARILGRTTASTGAVEELAASDVRTFLNTDESTDTRDPNLHAASHLPDGADEIFDQSLNTTDSVTFLNLHIDGGDLTGVGQLAFDSGAGQSVTISEAEISFTGAAAATTLTNIGAAASGSITTSGLTQATARILGRTTASTGAVEEITVGSGLSLSAGELSATASGGIGGGTGSTDNSILRSDGTGGSTLQDSAFVIADNATASPNNTVNHASIQATGGSTNVSVSIVPKGTGAFMLQVPNAAAGGGNARGAGAVDLQTTRSAATQVASGARSFIGGGTTNTASGQESVVCGGNGNVANNFWHFIGAGVSNTASGGQNSVVCGGASNTASGPFEAFVGGGRGNTASGSGSVVCGGNDNLITTGNNIASSSHGAILGGLKGLADRFAIQAHSAGNFSGNVSNTSGEAQRIRAVLRCKTTTNAAVEMALDGSATYLTIPSGKVIFCNIKVVGVKSDGAVVATYERQYAAKNVAGTSSEVFAPVTIGTDNASSTSLEVATVDAGDYIRIRPTGITSEIWRWVASVDAVEVAYGT
jgi:hypothetical protein